MTSDLWLKRVAFGTLAIAGCVVYVGSFDSMKPVARAVTTASAIAWIGFGAALLLVTRAKPGVLAWADACLAPMAAGGAALCLGALINVLDLGAPAVHAAFNVALNVAMALLFIPRAHALGLRTWLAVSLWLVALDGLFLFVVGGLIR